MIQLGTKSMGSCLTGSADVFLTLRHVHIAAMEPGNVNANAFKSDGSPASDTRIPQRRWLLVLPGTKYSHLPDISGRCGGFGYHQSDEELQRPATIPSLCSFYGTVQHFVRYAFQAEVSALRFP